MSDKSMEILSIEPKILTIRGFKVMIGRDLALLYGVQTKRLNEAVKRNIGRFPNHYMFQLSRQEKQELVANCDRFKALKHCTTLPYAFTEQGVAMLSSVLRSEKAIQVNIQIMNTFVKMRQWAIESKDIARRLTELEHYFMEHCKDNKADIQELKQAIDMLVDRTKPAKIGFKTD